MKKKVLVLGSSSPSKWLVQEVLHICQALQEAGASPILVYTQENMEVPSSIQAYSLKDFSVSSICSVLERESPVALLPTFVDGRQDHLILELERTGILKAWNVEVLGIKPANLKTLARRSQFQDWLLSLDLKVPASQQVHNQEEMLALVSKIEYPLFVREEVDGIERRESLCYSLKELKDLVVPKEPLSSYFLESSIEGFKEIEFQVLRDRSGTTMVVSTIENIDPVGIHGRDSVAVLPSQTLSDVEYQTLRNVSLRLVNSLKIEGTATVHIALSPHSLEYFIMEVSLGLTPSASLVSQATAYNMPFLVAQLALGASLDVLINPQTDLSYASFEPSLDYIVTKIPLFSKESSLASQLTVQQHAQGQLVACGRHLAESLLKACQALWVAEQEKPLVLAEIDDMTLLQQIVRPRESRLLYLLSALQRGYTVDELSELTHITPFFLENLQHLVDLEKIFLSEPGNIEILRLLKQRGFSDAYLASLWKTTENDIASLRLEHQIVSTYKKMDGTAGLYDEGVHHYYASYERENESFRAGENSILVLAYQKQPFHKLHQLATILSQHHQIVLAKQTSDLILPPSLQANKVYLEPLTPENIQAICHLEQPKSILVLGAIPRSLERTLKTLTDTLVVWQDECC